MKIRNDVIAVVASALLFAIPSRAQTHDDPADAVRAFYARYAAGDLRGALELWVAGAPAEDFLRRHRARLEKRCMRLDGLTADVISADPAVVDATSTFILYSSLPESPPWRETARTRLTLQREMDGWRIASWEPLERDFVERLIAAGNAAEQACMLEASPELHTTTLARIGSQRAIGLVNQGQYDQADALLATTERLAERLGDPVSMAASLSAESVAFRWREHYDVSLTLAAEAVALAEGGGDPGILAATLVRFARTVEAKTGIPDAPALARALELAPALEDVAIAAHAALHLGRTHELGGRFREAFRLAELSSRFAEESGDPAAQIGALLFLAGAYGWIGDSVLAGRYHRRAAELSREAGFSNSVALALVGIAGAVAARGDFDEALRILDEGLQKNTDPLAAESLLYARAWLYYRLQNLDAAERDLNEAWKLSTPQFSFRQNEEVLRGRIANDRGNPEAALAHFERAAREPNAPGSNIAREFSAEILLRLGRHEEARQRLEELIAEGDKPSAVDPQRSLFHPSGRGLRHLLLLELLVEEGQLSAALDIAEELKAKELRDAVVRGKAELPVISAEERAREQAIDDRIRDLNRRLIAGELSVKAAADVRAHLAEARTDLVDFRQRLYAGQPGLQAQHAGEVGIDDLPAALDDVTILSYVVGQTKAIAFLLEPKREGRRNLIVRTIALPVSQLGRHAAHLSTLIEQRNLRAPDVAAEIYELLVAPFEPQLRTATSLCIVPDGSLWRVPFHALGPRDGALLVERMPIFYAPSIKLLAESTRHQRRTGDKPRLLAFANPAIAAETVSLYRAFDPNAPLGAIAETESEVRAIAAIYGERKSRIYIGDAARETTLKHEASRYDVLHIATHGVIYDNAPMFSSLLLTASPEDRSEDGVLEAREIAALDLDAELAVLSACETGRSYNVNGGGVIGLSWAFLAAGCPTTVVSQWKAQSAATEKLMVEFHRQLARGSSKPAAMRRAQLALRRDPRYRHPFYWAPFVVIGMP